MPYALRPVDHRAKTKLPIIPLRPRQKAVGKNVCYTSIHTQNLENSIFIDGGSFLYDTMAEVCDFPKCVWQEVFKYLGHIGIQNSEENCFKHVPKGKYLWLFKGTVKQYYYNSCAFKIEGFWDGKVFLESRTLKAREKLKKDGRLEGMVLGWIYVKEAGTIFFEYKSHFRKPMTVDSITLLAVDDKYIEKLGLCNNTQ